MRIENRRRTIGNEGMDMHRRGIARKVILTVAAGALSVLLSAPAFAAEWKQDQNGWWYQRENGSYPVSTWEWIDGDGNGIEECYYFDENGYLLTSAVTPDGYEVNENGAWISDGTVQTRKKTLTGTYAGTLYFNSDPTVVRVTERADGSILVRYSGDSEDITIKDTEILYSRNPKYDGAYGPNTICYEESSSDDGARIYFDGMDRIVIPWYEMADFNSAPQYLVRQ